MTSWLASAAVPKPGGNSQVYSNWHDAISTDGRLEISDSTIADNGGNGATGVDSGIITVVNSQFLNNLGWGIRGTGQGHTHVTVQGSTVSGNGQVGVCCTACAGITVEGSQIENNGHAATGTFGGLEIARTGGGVALDAQLRGFPDPGVHISDSVIRNNYALHPGGGVLSMTLAGANGSTSVPVSNSIIRSTISGNTAVGTGFDGGGAAITVGSQVSEATFENNILAGGMSGKGGGLSYRPNDPFTTHFLSISSSAFSGNRSGTGGGIAVDMTGAGTAELLQVSLQNNVSDTTGGGAAFCVQSGHVADSSFIGNRSAMGGGLFACGLIGGNSLGVERSTFAQNLAMRGGGIAVNDIDVGLTNSTITNNQGVEGGGISIGLGGSSRAETVVTSFTTIVENQGSNVRVFEGTLRPYSSIIALPVGAGAANCVGPSAQLVSSGLNYVRDLSCGLHSLDTVSTLDPQLAALANNGGLTLTRLLRDGSPVRNVIPTGLCTLTQDQRAGARPLGAGCEPGSVEVP